MEFFSNCNSHEEAKKLYRRLSKCFHPDKSGDVELMIELKRQYESFKPSDQKRSENYVHNPFLCRDLPIEREFDFDSASYWKEKCRELQNSISAYSRIIEKMREEYPKSIWAYLKKRNKISK